jgi:hypothetical protein
MLSAMILPPKRFTSRVAVYPSFYNSKAHYFLAQASIKDLILERFDMFAPSDDVDNSHAPDPSPPATNGHAESKERGGPSATPISPTTSSSPKKREVDLEDLSDVVDKPPAKKKRKADPAVDADAAYAARLQAEENLRARPTRGGSTRKAAPVKKKKATPKSKTAKKVKAEDDSDLDGSEGGKKEVNRTGGFHVSIFPGKHLQYTYISNYCLRNL